MRTRRRRRDRGAAAVEMAIVLPLLLLLVFGMIDFSRLLFMEVQLSSAARDGARILALDKPLNDVRERAEAAWVWQDKYPLTTTPVTSCAGPTPGTATVRVSADFEWLTPVGGIASMFGGSGMSGVQTISQSGSMKCNL